ncbi:MAG: hypothetical protein J5641_00625 [Bacteroidales bacterium]|nr:hypothetical protein [Bacteroidales bacterium]
MWFTNLLTNGGVATTILMLSLSIFAGLLLGKIKFKGITLGITWVLFVGIALSAFGVVCNHDMLHVVKEFGLILFVTAVGLQVGPGFFRSFKKGGLAMNLLALVNVALGVGLAVLIARLSGEDLVSMAGVYTGAVTNTPGMSAAQQTVTDLGLDKADIIANGYAVAYPLAVVGMILTCIVLRPLCRIDMANEPTEEAAVAPQTSSQPASKPKVLLIPIFLIIAIGIVLGCVPIPVGMSAPVKLGLAGGPLVAALVGSWWGVKKGWLTTDFTESHGVAMIREVGIALFLAGVGLGAGGSFVSTIAAGGYMWVLYGFIITVVPPLLIGLFARLVLHVNYYTLMGFIGGSHTDPPTLAFANNIAPEGCKLPNVGYATVYPLTMFLRIFTAQLLVLMAV